jgi:hypothetical protein
MEGSVEEITGLILTLFFSAVCLVALFTGLAFLFPVVVSRTKAAADRMPGRCFLVGLVNLFFFGSVLLGFTALSQGSGQIFLFPALVILSILLIGVLIGLAGLASLLGERMFPERSAWVRTTAGGVTATLACLTPFIGWFGLFPFLACAGLGAVVLGWFQRN